MNFYKFKKKYEIIPVEYYQINKIKNPLVSICVQTYNHEPYISRCLDSIVKQKTDFEYEILIGEDQSNDETRDICIDYAKKFPEIISLFFHDRRNNILINNFETGRFNSVYNLFSSKGKFISLCEGDDFWIDEYKIQKQFNRCFKNDIEICITDYFLIKDKVFIKPKNFIKPKSEFFKLDLNKINEENYHLSHLSTFFFNRKYLEYLFNHPMLFSSWGLDTLLMPIFFENGEIYFDKQKMSCYRLNDKGLSRIKEDGSGSIYKFKLHQFEQLIVLHPKYKKFMQYKIMMNSLKYFCRSADSIYFINFLKSLIFFLRLKKISFVAVELKKLMKVIIKNFMFWIK